MNQISRPENQINENKKTDQIKILAINGSPLRKNTYSALRKIEDNFPDIDFEIIGLNEINLKQCRGCYQCIRLGHQHCPNIDDRDILIEKMNIADGIIFSSPVYVNFISSLMKGFMERLAFYSHRPHFFDKYAMVLSTCGMFGADKANKYMEGIFTTFGCNVVSSAELTFSTESKEEKEKNWKNTKNAVSVLLSRIGSGKKNKPSTRQLINFHIFKEVSTIYPDQFTADYNFHKDLSDFYYDAEINPIKKILIQRSVKSMINKIR